MNSERALADRCLRGEERAWLELVRTYNRRVLRELFRSGVRDDLDDLRQEVWARLLARNAAALRDFRAEHPGALGVLLAQVAHRVAIDHRRARRARPPASGGAEPDDLAHGGVSPESLLHDAQGRRRLLGALDAVAGSARDRDILRLHFEEGLSAAEIAEMGLDLEPRGIEAVIRRAREKILLLLRDDEP
jgi:RNA polymerase sigma factor (sigma-70 family)